MGGQWFVSVIYFCLFKAGESNIKSIGFNQQLQRTPMSTHGADCIGKRLRCSVPLMVNWGLGTGCVLVCVVSGQQWCFARRSSGVLLYKLQSLASMLDISRNVTDLPVVVCLDDEGYIDGAPAPDFIETEEVPHHTSPRRKIAWTNGVSPSPWCPHRFAAV